MRHGWQPGGVETTGLARVCEQTTEMKPKKFQRQTELLPIRKFLNAFVLFVASYTSPKVT